MCARLPQEYDGGTLMESILAVGTLPADFPRVIRAQREAVEAKIREMTNSDTIYPGLAAFREGGARRAGDIFAPVAPDSIPGVREAGWTPMPMRFRIVLPGCGDGTPTRANLHRFMRAIHTMVTEHADGWPFLEPVDGEEVTDYYEIVKEPIDLRLILERIQVGDYYITLEVRSRCVGALRLPVAAIHSCVCARFSRRTFGACSRTAESTTPRTHPTSSAPTVWRPSSKPRSRRASAGASAAALS